MSAPSLLEKYLFAVRKGGLRTAKPVDLSAASVVYLPANTIAGAAVTYPNGQISVIGGSTIGAGNPSPITSNSAQALAVGPNGNTNPTFNVDSSVANAATGINVQGKAAGSGVALSVASSGTNESLNIDAKGNATIGINTLSASAGIVTIGNSSSAGGRIFFDTDTQIRKVDAFAFNVGPNTLGGANAFIVDTSTGSLAAGLTLKGAVSGGTVALTVNDTGANSNLSVAAKGTGTITFQPAIAVPAGGAAAASILMSATASLGLYFGSGAPTVSAAQGSVYIRTDGSSVATRLYVNTTGSTTWTAITTAT
jgi:hypothetical protein